MSCALVGAASLFAESFCQAVEQFEQVCRRRRIEWREFPHYERGPDGERLATRVARVGPPDSPRVVVLNSGTHGVEGLAGSACLLAWLVHGNEVLPDGISVVLIHLINPWGTAWRRRQTEGNVDLNRNFVDFSMQLPLNPQYDRLRDALTPSDIEGAVWAESLQQIAEFRKACGEDALAHAAFAGQYVEPQGIGFGGAAPTWSNHTFRSILNRYASKAREVAFIDFHTGLGPFGHGTLLSTELSGGSALARTRSWFAGPVVGLKEEERAMPYDIQGDIGTAAQVILAGARVNAVTVEFGTFALQSFLELQIRDCWLQRQGRPKSPQWEVIRASLQDFFCPRDDAWRQAVQARACDVIHQAIVGLAG